MRYKNFEKNEGICCFVKLELEEKGDMRIKISLP